MRVFYFCVCVFVLVFFLGCSSSIKSVVVANAKDSNLNLNNNPVPITIYLFKLKNPVKFKNSSVNDLISRTDFILGQDKIDVTKVQMLPNDENVIASSINSSDVPYIGFAVIYNVKNENRKEKSLIATKDVSGEELLLYIHQKGIFIVGKNRRKELIYGK